MPAGEPKSKLVEHIPANLRWLAIAAGCSSGLAGSLLFGPLFFIFPSIQILGAAIEPYSLRLGKILLSIGACILTFYAAAFIGPQTVGGISVLRANGDLAHVTLFVILVISLALVAWCDAALITFAKRQRRSP